MRSLILFLALLPTFVEAKIDDTNSNLKPVVSKEGLERMARAVETVDANMKDTEQNIILCEKNRGVILVELKSLEKLEQEQFELISRYKNYVAASKELVDKNELATETINKWEKENKPKLEQIKGTAQTDLATKMNNARLDREQRNKWKADAEKKLGRVNRLLVEAEANLKNIQARRPSLKSQAMGWVQKQNEFKTLLKDLGTRRDQLALLIEAKKKELPPESGQ